MRTILFKEIYKNVKEEICYSELKSLSEVPIKIMENSFEETITENIIKNLLFHKDCPSRKYTFDIFFDFKSRDIFLVHGCGSFYKIKKDNFNNSHYSQEYIPIKMLMEDFRICAYSKLMRDKGDKNSNYYLKNSPNIFDLIVKKILMKNIPTHIIVADINSFYDYGRTLFEK